MKSGAIANSAGVSPHLLGASPDEAKAFFEDVFEKTVPSAFGFRPEVLWRPGPDPDTWVGEIRAQAP